MEQRTKAKPNSRPAPEPGSRQMPSKEKSIAPQDPMISRLMLETFIFNEAHIGDASRELRDLYGQEFLSDRFVMLLAGARRRELRPKTYQGIPFHRMEELMLPVLSSYGLVTMFPILDRAIGVLNLPAGLSDSPGGWSGAIAADLTHLFREKLVDTGLRCAIGAINHGPNVQQLYRTAEIVWDHCADSAEPVNTWYNIPWTAMTEQLKQETDQSMAALERQFMNHVHSRQFYEAVSDLDTLTNLRIWQSQASLRHIRSSTFFRLESVLATCGVSINPDQTQSEVYDALEQVTNAESFQALRGHTYDFFALLDDLLTQQEAVGKKAAVIRQFIDENYADPNLDASMICTRYKLSEIYLSRAFKQTYQMSWLDYVHQVRLRRAKELLEQTDQRIDDIAQAVGFTTRTMARVFKNSEGVSPSVYREAVRRTES